MGGVDDLLVGFSDGATLPVVLLVAALLGVRHALDPDHLAAVTAFVAGTEEKDLRTCARFGLAWGLGHGLTLLALGIPFILFGDSLPHWVERAAEALVGVVIVVLALRLLRRWRAGAFHVHEHTHEGEVRHVHLHSHAVSDRHHHPHPQRSTFGVLGIGVAHGVGGSAGIGVLLVASMDSRPQAVAALALLAAGTAAAMTALSSGVGLALFGARGVGVPAPLGAASLAFGVWYLLGALSILPPG